MGRRRGRKPEKGKFEKGFLEEDGAGKTAASNRQDQSISITPLAILDQIACGDSWDDIVKGFPALKKEDIRAALLYASALLDKREVKEAHA